MEYSVYAPPVTPKLTIEFENTTEPRELREELKSWTPTGGWSHSALTLFDALKDAANPPR